MAIAPQQLDDLTKEDAARLRSLERTVEKGLATFVEVGVALAQIRESRLYRATHKDFAGYCEDRFNLTARRVNQLIESATVVQEMGNMFPKSLPANSRVASELAKVEPEKRSEVWQATLEKKPEPTAADVRETAKAMSSEPEQPTVYRAVERQQIKDVEAQERDAIDSWVRRFAGFENKFLAVKELLKGMDSHVLNMTKLLVCPEDE